MSRFRVSARVVTGAGSYAWIAFHRCVEALSRLTGESFTDLFERVAAKHAFGRAPADWPNDKQLLAAQRDIAGERTAYLARLRTLIARRRQEKRRGIRHRRDSELEQLEALRRAHNDAMPRVGYWGWRARRLAESEPTSGSEPETR